MANPSPEQSISKGIFLVLFDDRRASPSQQSFSVGSCSFHKYLLSTCCIPDKRPGHWGGSDVPLIFYEGAEGEQRRERGILQPHSPRQWPHARTSLGSPSRRGTEVGLASKRWAGHSNLHPTATSQPLPPRQKPHLPRREVGPRDPRSQNAPQPQRHVIRFQPMRVKGKRAGGREKQSR